MVEINVKSNLKEFDRLAKNLSERQINKAASDAINKALLLGRSESRRQVKRVYNIPNRYQNFIDVKRAKPSSLSGHIFARTLPLPMDAFNPVFNITSGGAVTGRLRITRRGQLKQTNARSKNASAGVTIEVRKGRKTIVPYAFLIPGAKPRVFARGDYEQNGRYAFIRRREREENSAGNDRVTNMLSVTIYGALINRSVLPIVEKKVNDNFNRLFENALQRQIASSV
jgi:hypothetical protein